MVTIKNGVYTAYADMTRAEQEQFISMCADRLVGHVMADDLDFAHRMLTTIGTLIDGLAPSTT